MFNKFVLWWRVRRCESDLKLLREQLREHLDDKSITTLIALAEKHHAELILEQISRRQGWSYNYRCSFCDRENVCHVYLVPCRYCGTDAPAGLQRTIGSPKTEQ